MEQLLVVSRRWLVVLLLMMSSATLSVLAAGLSGGNSQPNKAIVNLAIDENFSNAAGIAPPNGWRNVSLAGNAQERWRFDNPYARGIVSPIIAPAAIAEFSGNGHSDFVLESPPFNASSSHWLTLSFDQEFSLADSGVVGKVEVFSGYAWNEVFSVVASVRSPRRETINITSAASCSPHARIRFRGIASRSGYWIIDNVTVIRFPVNTVPSAVASASPASGAMNVSPRTSLGWTGSTPCPTGYILYFGTDNPPSNIINGIDLENTPNFPFPDALSVNTTYFWKVVPYNAAGLANNCRVYSFTTGDNPAIVSLPYLQNFDGSTYGWESESANGDGATWEMTTTNPRSAPFSVVAVANQDRTTPGDDWLFSPPIRMAAGHQYRVDFWSRVSNAAMPEALEVKWGSDQLSSMMNAAPILREDALANSSYALSSAYITSPDSIGSSDVCIGWHYFSTAGTDALFLDDVLVTDYGATSVRYSEFNANRLGERTVRLSWRTISQSDNLQFEVERAIAPSIVYQTLTGSLVAGHGTTTVPINYSWTDNSAASSAAYYRLKQTMSNGTVHYSNALRVDALTSVSSETNSARTFTLSQNYPNPFNPETNIQFSVSDSRATQLRVFNTLGQLVATLFDGEAESGKLYTVRFIGSGLASGVYFYKLENGGRSTIKKLVLMK